jgi:hypothetical protein
MRPSSLPVASVLGACGLALCVSPAVAQESFSSMPLGTALARVYPNSPPRGGNGGSDATVGPDVAVGEIQNSDSGSSLSLSISPLSSNATYWAYGLGTTSCNLGNQNVQWNNNAATHPVIPVNMYKMYTSGGAQRFEQIGQSWGKHAFDALTENACALGCSGQGGSVLGVGCSDPYTASRNGNQANPSGGGGTGPRYIVNPYAATYPWPVPTPPPITDGTSRRIRVLKTDLEVSSASSVTQFFGEAIYITHDEATWGNGKNNASFRRMFCTNATTGAFTLEGNGQYNNGMHRYQPAIFGWQAYGNNNAFDTSVMISEVTSGGVFTPPGNPTGDGWMYIASKATDLGNGMFHYEYAVENLDSDRMGGSFSIPFPAGAQIANIGWKGVDNHSGVAAEDATRNAAWTGTVVGSSVTWSAPVPYNGTDYRPITSISGIAVGSPAMITSTGHGLVTGQPILITGSNSTPSVNGTYAVTVMDANTFSVPVNVTAGGTTGSINPAASTLGNGIRWGTLYNFRFDSSAAPTNSGHATLGFYKLGMPGFPDSITGAAWVPGTAPCYANCDASTTPPVLNVQDFTCFFQKFSAGDPAANCDGSTAQPTLNVADFTCFMQKFAQGCP